MQVHRYIEAVASRKHKYDMLQNVTYKHSWSPTFYVMSNRQEVSSKVSRAGQHSPTNRQHLHHETLGKLLKSVDLPIMVISSFAWIIMGEFNLDLAVEENSKLIATFSHLLPFFQSKDSKRWDVSFHYIKVWNSIPKKSSNTSFEKLISASNPAHLCSNR